MTTKVEYIDSFQEQIKFLNEIAWEGRLSLIEVKAWLEQFSEAAVAEDDEQLHAMFLLSHFIYFGQPEIRELLRSIYRDLFRAPILHEDRKSVV